MLPCGAESDLPYETGPEPRAQMVRLFFGLHLYLAGTCCKNLQNARGPAQCKYGKSKVQNCTTKRKKKKIESAAQFPSGMWKQSNF